jgi:quercetin dioxygenase-like cupin family protein
VPAAESAQSEPTPANPVVRTVVLDTVLRETKALSRVEVRRIQLMPGHPSGPHVHNSPVFGNILVGSVVYEIEGEEARILRAGDVFYEPEGARIARFDALEDGVTFFGYFLLVDGQESELTPLEA